MNKTDDKFFEALLRISGSTPIIHNSDGTINEEQTNKWKEKLSKPTTDKILAEVLEKK